jgi:hypothetical protein
MVDHPFLYWNSHRCRKFTLFSGTTILAMRVKTLGYTLYPRYPQIAGSWLFPHMAISWVLTQPHVSSCIPIISQPLLIAFHPAMRTSSMPGLRLWSLWRKSLRQMSSQPIRKQGDPIGHVQRLNGEPVTKRRHT